MYMYIHTKKKQQFNFEWLSVTATSHTNKNYTTQKSVVPNKSTFEGQLLS